MNKSLWAALGLSLAVSTGLLYASKVSHTRTSQPQTYSRSAEQPQSQPVTQDVSDAVLDEQAPEIKQPELAQANLEDKVKTQEPQVDIRSLIKESAEKEGIPLEILDSLVWKESSYNPLAENSVSQARGLTQLMPNTASLYGVANPFDAQENLRGGSSYLKWLYNKFTAKSRPNSERWKFALASYNAGLGNIQNAMNAARNSGVSTLYWDNVALFLGTSPSNREETVDYVSKISARAGLN